MAPLIVLLLVFLLRPVDPKVYETDDAIIVEAGKCCPLPGRCPSSFTPAAKPIFLFSRAEG